MRFSHPISIVAEQFGDQSSAHSPTTRQRIGAVRPFVGAQHGGPTTHEPGAIFKLQVKMQVCCGEDATVNQGNSSGSRYTIASHNKQTQYWLNLDWCVA
jgi:hypothetical protein